MLTQTELRKLLNAFLLPLTFEKGKAKLTIKKEINIKDVYSSFPEVINILLHDNTTGENIIWATDNYKNKGKSYLPTDKIKPSHLKMMKNGLNLQ